MKQFYRYLFLFCAVAGYAGAKMSPAGPFNYVIALDSGGVVSPEPGVESRGGVISAHLGRPCAVTHFLGLALKQDKIVICTVPVFRNLLTVGGDLLSKEHIAWWQWVSGPSVDKAEAEASLRDLVAHTLSVPELLAEKKYIQDVFLPHVQKDYDLYLAKTEDLMVCVPKGMTPAQVGVFPAKMEPFALGSDYGVAERALSKHETVKISIDNLLALFDKANKTPKNFVLNGHGYYDVELFGKHIEGDEDKAFVFAGLNPDEYRRFVQKLTEIWCQSLFVFTCFAGVEAVAEMHQKTKNRLLKLFFDVRDIKFPIIMGATGSNPMTVCINLTGLVCKNPLDLDAYFNAINSFVTKSSGGHFEAAKEPLRTACRAMQGEFIKHNTPSIRMPGKDSFFRAVSTDPSVIVLTVEDQKSMLAVDKDAQLRVPKAEDGMLLYYPAIITMPIVIPLFGKVQNKVEPVVPQLVSMAQGTFLHTFRKIDAKELDFVKALESLFGPMSPSTQGFVIDELVCLDRMQKTESESEEGEKVKEKPKEELFRGLAIKLSGKIVKSPAGKDTRIIRITAVRKNAKTGQYQEAVAPENFAKNDEGHWYMVVTNENIGKPWLYNRLAQTVWKDIDVERYKKVADEIISSTLPDNETIFQASGGQEFVKLVEASAKAIVAKTVA